jgi:hypothetical protein
MRTSIVLFSISTLLASGGAALAETRSPKLTPKAAEAVKQARKQKAPTVPAASGLKASRNPETGELRAPEAGELGPSPSTGAKTRVVVQRDGSLRAYLGDEHLSDLVAVKKSDGSVAVQCGPHGHEPAAARQPEVK